MKWLALLLGWMFTTTAWTQHPSQTFTEVNLVVATLTGYTEDVFPGGKLLLGMTRQPSDNFVVEFQAGVAFPSVATAKVGAGIPLTTTSCCLSALPEREGPKSRFRQLVFWHHQQRLGQRDHCDDGVRILIQMDLRRPIKLANIHQDGQSQVHFMWGADFSG